MKNWSIKRIFGNIVPLALFAASCSSPSEEMHIQYGRLSVSLAQPDVQVVTRVPEELSPTDPTASGYIVRLYNEGGVPQYEAAYNEFGTQLVPFGTYYITAENCSETEAEIGKGCMRLFGRSANVEVSSESFEQIVSVECTVQNAKFTVAFSELAASKLESLKVVLSQGTRNVTVNSADGETECWFSPGMVNYTITGSYNSKPLSQSGSVELQAKSNVRLEVQVSQDKGELLTPDVTFQNTIDTENNVSGGFNPYE